MERSPRTNFILIAAAVMVLGAGFFAAANAQVVGVTLPSVPTGVTATAGSGPGQVSVSWAASTESSGTIEGYYVYRNGAQITTTAGTSYTDAGLSSGYYNYTVAAYDASGYQSQQSTAASLTLIQDTTPPSTPTSVTISGATTTNSYYSSIPLTISWSASTDNVGVAGYFVYRNGTPITSSTNAFTGTSITDSVGPGTYTYTVAAYDAAQNYSAHSTPVTVTVSVDSTPPSTPRSVSVEQTAGNTITVSWASSTDPAGVSGYQVFRNSMQVASATGSPYADSGLSTNVSYSYTIAAYDAAGNVSTQSEPPATITVQPFTGPSAPTILGASLVGTSSAAITWGPSADPLAITGYTIYRDGGSIATVTSTGNYLDIGLPAGSHIYNITATDVTGAVSPFSASSTVIIPIAGTNPITSTVTTTVAVSTAPTTVSSVGAITQSLYYGLRNAQVTTLQILLANNGYLSSALATGFFGNLTLSALEKFQCAKGIACTNAPGWGIVGPKTRAVLNALGDATVTTTATSTSAMLNEIQVLEAELMSLEKQFPTGTQ